MKILIADKLSSTAVKALEQLGATVLVNPDASAQTLPVLIGDADVLIVRSTQVTAATIQAATGLSLIIRAGAGVNTIDLAAANSRGIHVANCPGKNNDAVAELVIGLMVAADRRIVDATVELRNGSWNKKEYSKARGLKGRTLGIIGLGSIGRAVARRAQGLEMNVIAWSRSLTLAAAEALAIGYCATPAEVAAQADVVSVHVAGSKETKHLIGAAFFTALKKDAFFINTARGDVVDTAAMKAAIKDKGLRVGLDVFENEPTPGVAPFEDRELAAAAVCTPHIGASTDQASEAIAEEVVNIVRNYMAVGKPLNAVNIRAKSCATISLVVRHYNRVGVLAGVLDELRNQGVNIEEMENLIFEGGATASCTLRLDDEPSAATLQAIAKNTDIIQLSLKRA
jgi:D-3-phosphoglycerate dehydrogenase